MRVRSLTVVTAALLLALTASPAAAAGSPDPLPYSHGTAVGVHNTYDKASFAHLAEALDTGVGLIELDVWADSLLRRWRVNHEIVGTSNNCTAATTASQLYTGSRDQNLPVCLDDLRLWHDAHPGHRPVIVKVELKAGFDSRYGLGPGDFDALLASKLGGAVYRPADLLGGYASLDAAAVADHWAVRSALAGRFIFEIIPGTFERGNPFDHLPTDVEYAQYLSGLKAAGQLAKAQSFPAVLDAAAGDPRTRYADVTLRPWFVVFDGAATAYVGGGVDPSWYDSHHYLLVMTDSAAVAPALDPKHPAPADAATRIALLAHDHASIVSTDWGVVPEVLSTVLERGIV